MSSFGSVENKNKANNLFSDELINSNNIKYNISFGKNNFGEFL